MWWPAAGANGIKSATLAGRQEDHIAAYIQDQGNAARIFHPTIFQDTGARFTRRASERDLRLRDFEVYVFQ